MRFAANSGFDFDIPHDAWFLLPTNSSNNYYFSIMPPCLYDHQRGQKALSVAAWRTKASKSWSCLLCNEHKIIIYLQNLNKVNFQHLARLNTVFAKRGI